MSDPASTYVHPPADPTQRWLDWLSENEQPIAAATAALAPDDARHAEVPEPAPPPSRFRFAGISLFWRTFTLITLLLLLIAAMWAKALYMVHIDVPESNLWKAMGLAFDALLTLVGVAVIARLINRPFKQLSFATSRIREGDFEASRLNEREPTAEIRQVNIGFNRMAQRLAKLEQDRAVMLAGISHDLRTPLSRLRLETEMSVADPVARDHMVADLEQLDAIIDKFMDYARPGHVRLDHVNLIEVIHHSIYAFEHREDMRFNLDLPGEAWVLADAVELGRVISNLVENARRYGKTPETGVTTVDISVRRREQWLQLRLRDHGPGVTPEHLPNLTKPFYRGDTARTAATGAGLGLAIVDKTVRRMGGRFGVGNSSQGGFSTRIELQQAK